MGTSPSVDSATEAPELAARWGNRTLAVSFVLIVIATTFPFEFFPQDTALRRAASVPFWLALRVPDIADFLENILLFLPFGFGLACLVSRRNLRNGTALFLSLLTGAGLSFVVELSQVFLPTRDASWDDVIANAAGAILGCIAFQLLGIPILGCLSFLEAKTEALLSPRRAITGFLLLTAVGFGVSAPLHEDHLSRRLGRNLPASALEMIRQERNHGRVASPNRSSPAARYPLSVRLKLLSTMAGSSSAMAS